MRLKIFVRVVCLLTLGGSLAALNLAAQDAAPSVAEAARKSQEQKKKAAKPAPVITDDTLHPNAAAPAAATDSNAPADSAKGSATDAGPSKKAEGASEDEKKTKAAIDALKQRIAEQKESVKLAQREIALQQDTFYSNPDYAHDKAGKDKLDAMKSDLQQKQDTLADLQAKLTALGAAEDSTPAPDQPKP
jgi:hypothetical protein